MRTTDIMTISLPPAMVRQMEKVQKEEHRTRSELLREAWRQYFESRYAVYAPTKTELAVIRKGRAAFSRGEFVPLSRLHDELDAARHQTRKKGSRKAP
ncbi:MAG: ribbon-helix-helix protein, CopG family [Bryobacteraceae bacterium]|jgi:predicted transcriptional regulator